MFRGRECPLPTHWFRPWGVPQGSIISLLVYATLSPLLVVRSRSIYLSISINTSLYRYTYIYLSIYMHIYAYVYVRIYIHIHICIYIYMYVYIYIYIYIYIHIYFRILEPSFDFKQLPTTVDVSIVFIHFYSSSKHFLLITWKLTWGSSKFKRRKRKKWANERHWYVYASFLNKTCLLFCCIVVINNINQNNANNFESIK